MGEAKAEGSVDAVKPLHNIRGRRTNSMRRGWKTNRENNLSAEAATARKENNRTGSQKYRDKMKAEEAAAKAAYLADAAANAAAPTAAAPTAVATTAALEHSGSVNPN